MNLFTGLLALFGYHAAPAPQPAPMPPVTYEVRSFVVTDEKRSLPLFSPPTPFRRGYGRAAPSCLSLSGRATMLPADKSLPTSAIPNLHCKATPMQPRSPPHRRRWRKLRRTMTARNTWLAHRPQHVRPVPHPTPQLATSRCARPNGARDGVTSSACLALSKAPL